MPRAQLNLLPEDWGRLINYAIGVTWALVFTIWTPSMYQGVVSLVAVHTWSALMGVGSLTGFVGTLTRRDISVELAGIYLILVGALLYLVAQIGFAGTALFVERVALLTFILWHMTMLLPRLFFLESYRRRAHALAKAGTR